MCNADETSQKISDLEKEYRKSQQKKGAESLMELEAQVRAKLKRQAEADEISTIRSLKKRLKKGWPSSTRNPGPNSTGSGHTGRMTESSLPGRLICSLWRLWSGHTIITKA